MIEPVTDDSRQQTKGGNETQTVPPASSVSRRAQRRERLAVIVQGQGLFAMAILIGVYFSIESPFFLTWSNALTVGATTAALGVMAVAQTFLIVSGGIDVSVGSVVAISSVSLATMLEHGFGFWPAALLAVGLGAVVGLINALLVVVLTINPLITTLGTLSIFQGLALALTGGQTQVVNKPELSFIGIGKVFWLPTPLVIFFVIFLMAVIVERYTAWGRSVYAIGGNPEAARLSGLHVRSTQTLLYVLTGASGGLAGVLVTAQLAAASPQVGSTYLLSVVTAVILGGASLAGGRGTVIGTLVAVAILGMLSDGFALLLWSSSAQTIALGVALIVAVLLDQTTRRLRGFS